MLVSASIKAPEPPCMLFYGDEVNSLSGHSGSMCWGISWLVRSDCWIVKRSGRSFTDTHTNPVLFKTNKKRFVTPPNTLKAFDWWVRSL